MATEHYALVVVGGGAGGLAAARAGVRRDLKTALVQDGRLGGDCTFTGCVPSKTLIESAAQGLSFEEATVTLRRVVEEIAGSEDAEALKKEGIEVVEGRAHFVAPQVLVIADRTLRADRIVLATGSAPAVPPIPGLSDLSYLTNETVFDLTELPRSLAILGGGPIGCELAQAFRRFGAEVHVVEAESRLLPREEPEASEALGGALTAEGVKLHLGTKVVGVDQREHRRGVQLRLADGSAVRADQLLVAVGRRPVTDVLQGFAGPELDERGFITVDSRLRTTSPGVYAVGDVTGRLLFTHAADEMGRVAVQNAFSRAGRARFETASLPWVTFTDPEVARVGMLESQATERRGRVAFLPMDAVDRARMAGRTEGFVKLVAGPRPLLGNAGGGVLLGATIVAPRAGEMIHEASLAMRTKMFTGRLAQAVHAYPTWSTAVRQAAAQLFFEIDGRRAVPAGRRSNPS